MSHARTHSHAPVALPEGNIRLFIIGIVLNMAFVLVEVVAGLLYNSMALLSDAGHNFSDVAGLIISLIAFWMARRQSNAVYTYGYKKTTVLAALSNAVILLIAIGILGFESISRLLHPVPVPGGVISWIGGIGIVINGITALLFMKNRHELNSRSAYLHMASDALVSLGVMIAGFLIRYTGYYWIDPAISLVVVIVIFFGTLGLLKGSFRMSIDAVPAGIKLQEIKDIIAGVSAVRQVHHVHVWPLSTTENALTAQVVIDEHLSFERKLEVVEEIKHRLQHNNIHHSTIELTAFH